MIEYVFSDETDEVVCEICGGKSGVGIRRVMFDGFSCQHCLHVWYEGAGTDSDAVLAASLKRQGRTPDPTPAATDPPPAPIPSGTPQA